MKGWNIGVEFRKSSGAWDGGLRGVKEWSLGNPVVHWTGFAWSKGVEFRKSSGAWDEGRVE